MAFASGDTVFLWKLFEHRYLQTGQLCRLTGRSGQVIRRRMRDLIKSGYAVALDDSPMEEKVYALGPAGWEFIAGELKTAPARLPYSKITAKIRTPFLRHVLLTNTVRIAMEAAALAHLKVVISRTIHEWEMADPTEKKDPTKKFLLWERLTEGEGSEKKTYSHRPDCLFLVYNRDDGPDYTAALFLEADRKTESVAGKIDDKFSAYRIYFQQKLYWQRFKAGRMRCLFVLEGGNADRRIATMQRQLQSIAAKLKDPAPSEEGDSAASFVYCFRFTDLASLSEETAFDATIWLDWKGNRQSLFKQPKQEHKPEHSARKSNTFAEANP